MKLIERKSYLEKLLSVRGTPDIKVITGVRRSGKSKLMEAYRDLVCAADPAVNVIHVNFNLHEFDPLLTPSSNTSLKQLSTQFDKPSSYLHCTKSSLIESK